MLFLGVKSTKNNISKIGKSVELINLPKIDMQDFQRDMPSMDTDIDSTISNVSESDSNVLKIKNPDFDSNSEIMDQTPLR